MRALYSHERVKALMGQSAMLTYAVTMVIGERVATVAMPATAGTAETAGMGGNYGVALSNSVNARHSAANLRMIDRKGPVGRLIPVAISLILLGCSLLGVAVIRANDIAFVSARLVDYHDQQELPVPRSAGAVAGEVGMISPS
jgi:hypothetical protein